MKNRGNKDFKKKMVSVSDLWTSVSSLAYMQLHSQRKDIWIFTKSSKFVGKKINLNVRHLVEDKASYIHKDKKNTDTLGLMMSLTPDFDV